MNDTTAPWSGAPQPGREPRDERHTGQLGHGAASPGSGGQPRPARWALGIAPAALVAAVGTAAGLALTSHPGPASRAVPTAGTGAQGFSGQAALLGATLRNASAPGPLTLAASGAPVGQQGAPAMGPRPGICARAGRFARTAHRAGFPLAARAGRRLALRCRFARRRLFEFFLLRGVDGQFTVQTRHGLVSRAFERGVIESVSPGHSLVVRTTTGPQVTWSWQITSTTVVRGGAGKVPQSSLAAGEQVWAGGPVVSGTKDARLIVLNPPGLLIGGG